MLIKFIHRLFKKMNRERNGLKEAQRKEIRRSQSKIAQKIIITQKQITENHLVILLRKIQRPPRFKSPITFTSGHEEAKPLIATV